MQDFSFQHPGRLLCGESMKETFAAEARKISERALLICGPHFARSGELPELEAALEKAGIRCWLVPDLRIPSIEHARVLWALCRQNSIGLVVGAGGATVMDFAKVVACGAAEDEDIWPVIAERGSADGMKRIGLATVPTYPSSGSDLDGAAEMVEKETGRMGGLYGDALRADLCWLNPGYLTDIPPQMLAYGAVTAAIQASVAYLAMPRCDFQEQSALAVIRTIFKNLPLALENGKDKRALGELQLAACMNGFGPTYFGKGGIDFSLYFIEGMAELYWDIPYVPAITILFPHWLRAVWQDNDLFRDYFRQVWQVETDGLSGAEVLEKGLAVIRGTYEALGIAWTFKGLKPMPENRSRLLKIVKDPGPCECAFRTFTDEDIASLIESAVG